MNMVKNICLITLPLWMLAAAPACAASHNSVNDEAGGLYVPLNRSELVVVPEDISEVLIASPDIADVHVIGSRHVAFIGKKLGQTNAKFFDKKNNVIRQFDVLVGYDLPGIRKALHTFLPREHIGVELVNTNIALTGQISDASVADEAIKIVNEFVKPSAAGGSSDSGGSGGAPGGASKSGVTQTTVLNLMKVLSGQQVMLRVRIGEIQRSALKQLGVDLSAAPSAAATGTRIFGGAQGGVGSLLTTESINSVSGALQSGVPTGSYLPGNLGLTNSSSVGVIGALLQSGRMSLGIALEALEQDGLLKTLAEPDLVAMSGERAEFLAGGEFPVVTVTTAGSLTTPSTTFQPFGVSVQFIPLVLSDNRIRLTVMPEVSAIDSQLVPSSSTPGLDTRRVKTTVELAPGESFMLAGLLSDSLNANINQLPGASDLPVLGALLRNTSYKRNETELVIAVTPYIVDPLKSSDVRLPTDDFRPASDMEMFFYGALGSLSGNARRISQTPTLEGPIGFMTD